MGSRNFDIAVIGAGMVGASLALAAARAGWSVAVVEPAPPEAPVPEGEPDLRVSALSYGSERWLRRLGVWSRMAEQRWAPFRELAVWEAPSGPLRTFDALRPLADVARTHFTAASINRPHLGHIVENQVTQHALWQSLQEEPNLSCFSPGRVRTLKQQNDRVELTLDDDTAMTSRLVVGADGANSPTRALAGIGTSRQQYRQQAMVVSVIHDPPEQSITWQMFTPKGPRAYLPMPSIRGQCRASLVWYDQPERLDQLMSLNESELIEAITDAFPDELPTLIAAPDRGRFPIARQHAHEYSQGRVTLIGDAAHTINPLAGQGVNLGFQDAACLARLLLEERRLEGDPGSRGLLQAYEEERRPRNRLMMDTMDLFYTAFSNRQPPAHLIRNLGLGLAGRLPMARERVARYAMGIDDTLPRPLESLLKRLA